MYSPFEMLQNKWEIRESHWEKYSLLLGQQILGQIMDRTTIVFEVNTDFSFSKSKMLYRDIRYAGLGS